MVIYGQCYGVRCPLGPYWTSQLLGSIQGLLVLGAVQHPKLSLSDAEPIICLKQVLCPRKDRWVSHQEVYVGCVHVLVTVVLQVEQVLCILGHRSHAGAEVRALEVKHGLKVLLPCNISLILNQEKRDRH
jgi:hypothetical protein